MSQPLVSVIVSTRNTERTLKACLESVRNQTYSPIELILVDNSSTDRTIEIAKEYCDGVYDQSGERCKQRNLGFQKSKGEYFFYIDADMELEPEVVEACVECCQNEGVGAVVIHERSFGQGFWTACKAHERACYIGDMNVEAARFFTREVFEKTGGFDESIIAGIEDWDLHERVRNMGTKMGTIKPMINHDEGKIELIDLCKKKLYYASHLRGCIKPASSGSHRTTGMLFSRLYLFRPAFWRNIPHLLRHPIRTVGMCIMLTFETFFGALGYIRGKKT